MRNPRPTTGVGQTVLPALTIATIGLFVAAVGVGLLHAQERAQDKDAAAQNQAARVPAVVPLEARNRENPIPADERSIDFGKLIFSSQCVMCHGKEGVGDGDLVARLALVVPDLTDPATLKGRTDGELFYILTNGHGSMPGQESRFDEKTRWDLVNYLRTLPIEIR